MISRRAVLAAAVMAAPPPSFAQQADGAPPLPPTLGALSTMPVAAPGGAASTLGAHLRPGPAVITFWATWCSPCVAEGRRLAEWRTRIAAERLNIIGVNLGRDRSDANLKRFMRRARMIYTQLWGTAALYRAFNNPLEGSTILLPRLYVFAADGVPAAAFGRYEGASSLRRIDRAIEAVLA